MTDGVAMDPALVAVSGALVAVVGAAFKHFYSRVAKLEAEVEECTRERRELQAQLAELRAQRDTERVASKEKLDETATQVKTLMGLIRMKVRPGEDDDA